MQKNMFRGNPLIKDKAFRRKLAELEVDENSLLYTFNRSLSKFNVVVFLAWRQTSLKSVVENYLRRQLI